MVTEEATPEENHRPATVAQVQAPATVEPTPRKAPIRTARIHCALELWLWHSVPRQPLDWELNLFGCDGINTGYIKLIVGAAIFQ